MIMEIKLSEIISLLAMESDISKKEIVDIEMTFNMILDGDKWVISKNNGVEINDKSITITDKE